MESAENWIVKRRHEEIGVFFRTLWDLYFKFYTVFLTFSVVGLGVLLKDLAESGVTSQNARRLIALVFLVQTLLTAATSWMMAAHAKKAVTFQRKLEQHLLDLSPDPVVEVPTAIPIFLSQWAGKANCVAMIGMAVLWLYVGFWMT